MFTWRYVPILQLPTCSTNEIFTMIIAYYLWVWCMSTLVFGLRNKESKTVAKHTFTMIILIITIVIVTCICITAKPCLWDCSQALHNWRAMEAVLLPGSAHQLFIWGKREPRTNAKLHVACRICDWDQIGIKRSMFVLSRDQDESWATYINQSAHFVRYWGGMTVFFLPFEPL